MAVTYDYFGASPVSIVFQTSDQFDGAAFLSAVIPNIGPGIVTFPVQSGGGRLDFHKRPIIVKSVHIVGGGNGVMSLVHASGAEVELTSFTNTNHHVHVDVFVPVTSYLKFVTSGAGASKKIEITAVEVVPGNL